MSASTDSDSSGQSDQSVQPDVATADHRALLSRVAEGDESALSALYDAFAGKVHALSTLMAADAEAAAAVTRETFLSVWRQAGTYDAARCSPLAWVLGLARATGRGMATAA